jgi:hypothetical protein
MIFQKTHQRQRLQMNVTLENPNALLPPAERLGRTEKCPSDSLWLHKFGTLKTSKKTKYMLMSINLGTSKQHQFGNL